VSGDGEPEARGESGGNGEATRTTSDRVLDVAEACLWIALVLVGGAVALTALRGESARPRTPVRDVVRPSIEAEDMPVVAKSREFTFWLQPTSGFRGGRWSRDGHMFAMETRKGDWIDLELPVQRAGSYRLELLPTKSADYGIVVVSLNGVRIGDPIDLWSGRGVVPGGAVDLGRVDLRGGGDVLRMQVTGTNPAAVSPFFQFALDGVRLTRE
jgi:hypothetical protein